MRKTAILLAMLSALAIPAVASARVLAPPGNSQVDQYFETVPESTGGGGPASTKTPSDAVREGKLSAANARALNQAGPDGHGVARIIAETAPPGVGLKKDGARGNNSGAGTPVANNGLPEGSKDGMGFFFPLILIATAVAALIFAVERHRRSSPV